MLKSLKDIKPQTLMYLDIETRAQVEDLKEGTPLYDLAEYTVSRMDNFEEDQQILDYYKNKAALMPELGAITCISVGFIANGSIRTTSFYGEDELEILKNFVTFCNKVNFKAVCGFASNDFDIPYIMVRMFAHGMFNIPDILDESDKKPWEKVNVDLKQETRLGRPRASSLLGLCTTIGVPSPKDGITGKEVSQAFFDGRIEEIKEYCERDVASTANCLLVLQGYNVLDHVSVEPPIYTDENTYASYIDEVAKSREIVLEKAAIEMSTLTKKQQGIYTELLKVFKA